MKRLLVAALLLAACDPVPPASNPEGAIVDGLPETDPGYGGAVAPAPLPRCYQEVPAELAPDPQRVAGLPPCA